MTDKALNRYLEKRKALEDRTEGIRQAATEGGGRDFTDEELQHIRAASDEIVEIDGAIETLTRATELGREARLRIDAVTAGGETKVPKYRDVGELVHDMLHYREDEGARVRFDHFMARAEHMGTDAAITTPTAGSVGAVDVIPKVGPVTNPTPARTPFLTALSPAPMPGYSFERPYIVDPNFDTGAGEQTLQKAELPSVKFDAAASVVQGKTYGAYLNVSLQVTTWTPNQLAIIIGQLARRRDSRLEVAAVTEAQASTGNVQLEGTATAAEFQAAIYRAARKVWEVTEEPATWILMGPLGWERFGGFVDAADRPLFPTVGAANAIGTLNGADGTFGVNPAGLRPIVSGKVTTAEFWVGNELGIEAYQYNYPILQSLEASVLGQQVAVASSLVMHRPEPTKDSIVHMRPGAETP